MSNEELKRLIKEAHLKCEEYLGKFDEGSPTNKADAELMMVVDSVSKIVEHRLLSLGIDLTNLPPGFVQGIEIARGAVSTGEKTAVARVSVDQYKKLMLMMTPLCKDHGVDCNHLSPTTAPRNVTLRELRLIGFTSVAIVKDLRDFLSGALGEEKEEEHHSLFMMKPGEA